MTDFTATGVRRFEDLETSSIRGGLRHTRVSDLIQLTSLQFAIFFAVSIVEQGRCRHDFS